MAKCSGKIHPETGPKRTQHAEKRKNKIENFMREKSAHICQFFPGFGHHP
jgi:hypothetical protein